MAIARDDELAVSTKRHRLRRLDRNFDNNCAIGLALISVKVPGQDASAGVVFERGSTVCMVCNFA
jgi:hypothetical protein